MATKLEVYDQPFDTFDIRPFAKPTRKLLDRLASWSQMKNYSAEESEAIVAKILEQIATYVHAVESSIMAVVIGYRLSTDSMLLCNLVCEETPRGAEQPFDALTQELYQSLISLAEEGYSHADKARTAFLNVEQDLYKIAAETKDNEMLVQVPINNEKQVFKSLKTVGNDLVAGAKLMTEFYDQLGSLVSWWALLKREISAEKADCELLPISPHTTGPKGERAPSTELVSQTFLEKWGRLQKDHLAYYNMTDDIITQYATLLPVASASWVVAISPQTSSPTPNVSAPLASFPSTSPSSTPSKRSARLRALLGKLKHSLHLGFGHNNGRRERLKEITRSALKALSPNSDPNKGNGTAVATESKVKGKDTVKDKAKKSQGNENTQL